MKTFSKGKIIGIHGLSFILLTALLFIVSDSLLKKFASGIHNVGMWTDLMIFETIGLLITTLISCMIFLKQVKIIGFIIILVNLFWTWFNLDLLYKYHFTEFYPTYYISNRTLIINSIFAIAGIIIGFQLINKKMSVRRALLTSIFFIYNRTNNLAIRIKNVG